ncbi:hypothetical protein [Streptomyces sp. NPDC050704]|uniref:hypothetical protein n=1 Tax=Streptomyces sp. NPDC050704 TaxID=3157219 RepID=UPI003445E575
MTTSGGLPPGVDGFACRFDLQAGWVDLTLQGGSKAEATGLAGSALDEFNPLELQVSKRGLMNDLIDRAMDLNSDDPILAASYYGRDGVSLINLVVDSYGEDGAPRPSREEVQPLLVRSGPDNTVVASEPDISYLDIPAGPAVRIQAMAKAKRMFGFGSRLNEFIKYAVFPPNIEQLIVITANWQDIQRTDELAQVTDGLVATMRNVPLDANGQEIVSGPLE